MILMQIKINMDSKYKIRNVRVCLSVHLPHSTQTNCWRMKCDVMPFKDFCLKCRLMQDTDITVQGLRPIVHAHVY